MTTKLGRPKLNGPTPIRSIRVSDTEWEAWRRAAEAQGLTVTQWLRQLAAKEITHHTSNGAHSMDTRCILIIDDSIGRRVSGFATEDEAKAALVAYCRDLMDVELRGHYEEIDSADADKAFAAAEEFMCEGNEPFYLIRLSDLFPG